MNKKSFIGTGVKRKNYLLRLKKWSRKIQEWPCWIKKQ